MNPAACAVGRIGAEGPWVGFARGPDGGHVLAVGTSRRLRTATVGADTLLALAIAYFEDALQPPPDELAATHADIGALVTRLAEVEADPKRSHALAEALDAIDDGLAADVVIARLESAMTAGGAADAVSALEKRARALAGDD